MPRIATKLIPAAKGGFFARKVVPGDVRDEYAEADGLCRQMFGGIPLAKMLAMAVHQATHEERTLPN